MSKYFDQIKLQSFFYKAFTLLFVLTGLLFVSPLYLVEPLMWVWLIYIIAKRKFISWDYSTSKLPFLLFTLFYLFELLSLLYSSDLKAGIRIINKYLPFFVISLLVYITPVTQIPISKAVKNLIGSIFLGIIGSIVFVFFSFVHNKSLIALLNINVISAFREVLGLWMHRSYIALALAVALLIIYLFVDNKEKLFYWLLTYITAFIFVWNIGARIPILYFIFILVGVLFDIGRRWMNTKVLLGISAIFIAILSIVVIKNSDFGILQNLLNDHSDQLGSLDSRFQIWNSVRSVIEAHPFWGIGVGDAQGGIIEAYRQNNFSLGDVLQLNTHNQFLQLWIESGIPGMLMFTLAIVSGLVSFRNVNLVIRILYVTTLLAALFVENIIARSAGREVILFSMILLYLVNESGKMDLKLYTSRWKVVSLASLLTVLVFFLFPYQMLFKMDPKRPETYRNGNFKTLNYKDLPETVPNAIPHDANALLLDTLVFKQLTVDKPYDITIFGKYATNLGDSIYSNVYAYVSPEFNGDVFLFSKNELLKYNIDSVQNKGIWEYLNIRHYCVNGKEVVGLYIGMKKGESVADLKGYILFVYPQSGIIEVN
ncbi:O-antigen ligase family protein [Saccharicrinis sp. FJH2]|uniref:O-antigen ligase family protein n=1 Tax=Saccharicrinis sp. FJH65 TaxID=3344659 RepID=UPI0035F2DCFD